MNKKTSHIKNFWKEQAQQFKKSQLATAPDIFYRNLEIENIEKYLRNGGSVLDIGCGNGFSTIRFAEHFPKIKIIGIDYSPEMIKYANQALSQYPRLKERVSFRVGDVLSLSSVGLPKTFDYIVSERCLINLLNWEEQQQALFEMKQVLKKGGRIVLCENTQEGLERLNKIRKTLDLKPIKVRWHNYYMPESKLLRFVKKHFVLESVKNIGSLYYIISRVVYAKLCDVRGVEPDYLNPINEIASKLEPFGDCSPNYIFLLKKQ